MTSPSKVAFETFLALAREWSAGYCTIVHTALALKYEDEWNLQLANTFFVSEFVDDPKGVPTPMRVETNSILAVREVIDCTSGLITRILNEERFDPFQISILENSRALPTKTVEPDSYFYEPMHRRDFPSNWRWPTLTAAGHDRRGLFHKIGRDVLNLELLSNDIPFESIDDLLNTLSLPISALQSGQSIPQAAFVISHPAVILQESSISGNHAKVFVKCRPEVDQEKISISVRAFNRAGLPNRFHIPKQKITWVVDDRWAVGTAELSLDDNPVAAAHLSYADEYLGMWIFSDPNNSLNHRNLVHKCFHRDRDLLKILTTERGTQFEDAVTLLLSLLGLNCVPYGTIGHLKDGPDIIAYSGYGHLYVIECTSGDIGKDGKLHKLSLRSEEVRNAIRGLGTGIQHILPVLVTNLSWEQTKARWIEAAELGISLVCLENLENLVGQLDFPPSAQALFDAAVASIPRNPNQPQFN